MEVATRPGDEKEERTRGSKALLLYPPKKTNPALTTCSIYNDDAACKYLWWIMHWAYFVQSIVLRGEEIVLICHIAAHPLLLVHLLWNIWLWRHRANRTSRSTSCNGQDRLFSWYSSSSRPFYEFWGETLVLGMTGRPGGVPGYPRAWDRLVSWVRAPPSAYSYKFVGTFSCGQKLTCGKRESVS